MRDLLHGLGLAVVCALLMVVAAPVVVGLWCYKQAARLAVVGGALYRKAAPWI